MIRVTEVLDWVDGKELARWRGKVGNRAADKRGRETAKRGTTVHELICRTLKGEKVRPPKAFEVAQAYKAWLEWYRLNEQVSIGNAWMEETLVDEERGLQGTPDLFTSLEGFDWKTGWPSWKHIWQLNEYAYLHNLVRPNFRVNACRVVYLSPETGMFRETAFLYSERIHLRYDGLLLAYKESLNGDAYFTQREVTSDEAVGGSEVPDVGAG